MKKNITDYFHAFDTLQNVYEVASFLVDEWGLEYYYADEFRGRECNRQFRSMMDDNEAWGNIE